MDITLCVNEYCNLRKDCKRGCRTNNTYQSYSFFSPTISLDKIYVCDFYLPIKNK